jgi:hypothetical protein
VRAGLGKATCGWMPSSKVATVMPWLSTAVGVNKTVVPSNAPWMGELIMNTLGDTRRYAGDHW